ncbi:MULTISPECIES: hypothetical protein [unclassified Caballeronia]|uniref:hypothetical protein n=1 Tax=unclassified Caballeronia TaxID=2646786 RepID=UPI002028DB49|nr:MULTISPECIES: hypothetical protein [unclassified Caballeronia]
MHINRAVNKHAILDPLDGDPAFESLVMDFEYRENCVMLANKTIRLSRVRPSVHLNQSRAIRRVRHPHASRRRSAASKNSSSDGDGPGEPHAVIRSARVSRLGGAK